MTRLPGNTDPDITEDLDGADMDVLRRFLDRLNQVRGTYGRDQIRRLKLQGWDGFGRDLDLVDGIWARHRRGEG